MLKNVLTITWRSLSRNKVSTLLNLAGLGLGIASSLMIFMIVRYELSFDTFHEKSDRIYRLTTQFVNEEDSYLGSAPFPAGEALAQEFPQVETKTSVYYTRIGTMKAADRLFKEEHIAYVEPSFFDLFDFDWVAGDPEMALKDPYSVVLTASVARRYFGENDPGGLEAALGEMIQLDNETSFKVTGIMEDFPQNTDFPFEILLSYPTLQSQGNVAVDNWINLFGSLHHYILLKEGADVQEVEAQLPELLCKYMAPEEAAQRLLLLQPLSDVHFDDRFGNFNRRVVTKGTLLSLSLVGIFLLLTACINFINLTTAQAVKRSKEVGVRKVLGAPRSHLIRQFMAETLLLGVFAMLLALLITGLSFPLIMNILNLPVADNWLFDPVLIRSLLMITVLVSLAAGLYPALILSGFQPLKTLKGKIMHSPSSGGLSLRRGLIVFQFLITQVLLIGTLVVVRQLDYSRSQPLGFAKEAIVTVQIPETEAHISQSFRNQVLQIPGIQQVALSRFSPSSLSNWEGGFNFFGSDSDTGYPVVMRPADPAYLETFDMKLLAGRNILETDSLFSHVLINEALLRQMGIQDPQEAVGVTITVFDEETRIAGVVEDFHTHSLREVIKPTLVFNDPGNVRLAALKINLQDREGTLAQVEQLFKEQFPESLFEYAYLDETIAAFYREEEKLSQLFMIFSGMAIAIGCLGVYGLISFMTVQKTKEVGVRKVLGASLSHIVFLFTKELMLLILFAFALAAPVAWYVMNGWLQGFEYRIALGADLFLVSVGATMLITLVTVGYRSISAALVNPVDSLRSE